MSIPRHSFSRLNTFAYCGMRYYLDAISPRRPDTPAQARGRHVHNVLEFAAKRVLAGPSVSWKDGIDEGIATVKGPLTLEGCRAYCSHPTLLDILERIQPVSAERWFDRDIEDTAVSVWDENGKRVGECPVQLCGKVDLEGLFEGADAIFDYKTVNHPGKILTLSEIQKSLQGRLYSLESGVRRVGFIYILPNGVANLQLATYTEQEVLQTKEWLQMTVEAVNSCWRTGVWHPATPDYPWCHPEYCPFWDKCIGSSSPKE